MKPRAPASLQSRVLLLVFAAAALLWAAAAASTWIDTRHELDELLDAHLAQSAALLVAREVHELEQQVNDAPVTARSSDRVTFQLFHEGRLALRSQAAPLQPLVPFEEATDRGEFRTVVRGGEPWRIYMARGGEPDVVVLVGENLHSRSDILEAMLRSTIVPFGIGLPLLALALAWSVRRGLRPLQQLGDSIAAREAGDFSPVSADGAPREVQPVVDALNRQFERTEALVTAERRFIADAAHELRTPLAGIRAHAQVAAGEPDERARNEALAATIAGCDRAARLAGQLLALSRLDATSTVAHEPVDLCEVVRDVIAQAAPEAIRRGIDMALHAPDSCIVEGDAGLLSILARNLVDNAVRYAPEGGEVRAAIDARDPVVTLTVENSGAPLSHDELQRLGERFYRANPGADAAGSGLGLSIVQLVARLHGAKVAYSGSTLGSLKVEVTFPAR